MAEKKSTNKKKSTSKVAAKTTAAKAKTQAAAEKAKQAREAAKAHAEVAKAHAEAFAEKGPGRLLAGFISFVREKGVVGLAVGLAIGTAATVLVKQIVDSVITPAVGLLIGDKGLNTLDFTITVGSREETFAIGALVNELIKFLAVAAVIYFVVMGLKLDKLDKKADK